MLRILWLLLHQHIHNKLRGWKLAHGCHHELVQALQTYLLLLLLLLE